MNKVFKLQAKYSPAGDQVEAIDRLGKGLAKGYNHQTLLGVTGSGKTFTMANVVANLGKATLVIAPNKALAAQLYREYKNYFPDNAVHYFVSYYDYYQPEAYIPITDTYIDKEAMINEEIDRLRHGATSALLSRQDVIIVASVSCIYNLGVPTSYLEAKLGLSLGQTIVRSDLLAQLVTMQFERSQGEIKLGQFALRGDTFLIRPKSEQLIYQIEIKDQVVDSILVIDGLSQKIVKELKEVIIFPPKHFVTQAPELKQALHSIEAELVERVKYFQEQGLLLEAERLSRRTKYDLEMLSSLGYCHGIENYSRHLSGKLAGDAPDSLLAYFPKDEFGKPDFLTIIDESHITVPQLRGMYNGDRARKETLIKYGWRLPSALDNRPLRFSELQVRLGPVIYTSATPASYERKVSQSIVKQIIRPTGLVDPVIEVRPVFVREKNYSQIDDVIKEARIRLAKNERVIINTLTKRQAEDLSKYFQEHNLPANYLHSDVKTLERTEILTAFRAGKFGVLIGVNLLREGLDLPEVTLVAILDADREGFLRSQTSLLQTMGRAARNVSGQIILYANTITESMRLAISESSKRRELQLKYNQKHGIVAQTVVKEIEEMIDLVPASESERERRSRLGSARDRNRSDAEVAREDRVRKEKANRKKVSK